MNAKSLFCFNNFFDEDNLQYSSQQTSFPATNVVDPIRSKVWKPNGLFEITASNRVVYINGGSFNIPVASYTFATLATAFAAASGATLTLARNGDGLTTISGSSFTANFSSTTNAIWNTLGYFRTVDDTGTVITSDDSSYSTGEWLKVDVGFSQQVKFVAIIPVADEAFSVNLSASVRFQGNNVDAWTTPLIDEAMDISYRGALLVPVSTDTCRYFRILIDDPTNNAIKVAVAFLGNGYQAVNTNIATGFTRNRIDPSDRMLSESGAMYTDRRTKLLTISSLQVQLAVDTDLTDLEQLAYDLGNDQAFFLVMDPDVGVSSSLDEMTHYVVMDGDPNFQNAIRGYYSLSFAVREVV